MSFSHQTGFEGTYEEHVEYIGMRHIENGETPTEWKNDLESPNVFSK